MVNLVEKVLRFCFAIFLIMSTLYVSFPIRVYRVFYMGTFPAPDYLNFPSEVAMDKGTVVIGNEKASSRLKRMSKCLPFLLKSLGKITFCLFFFFFDLIPVWRLFFSIVSRKPTFLLIKRPWKNPFICYFPKISTCHIPL